MRRLQDDRQAGFVSVLALVSVAAVSVLGLVGPGSASSAVTLLRGAFWLPNSANGTVSHVNGFSGKVDGQSRAVATGKNGAQDAFHVVQRADGAYVVDDTTGSVARLDGASLQVGTPSRSLPGSGPGVLVATGGGHTWEVDHATGAVVQIDPLSLQPQGHQLSAGGPASSPVVDSSGDLWVALDGTGTVAHVAAGDDAPTTVAVGSAGDVLSLTLADGTAVAYDQSAGIVRSLPDGRPVFVPAGAGPAVAAGAQDRGLVLVVGTKDVTAVTLADRTVRTFPFAAATAVVKAAVSGHRGYLLDAQTHAVDVLDLDTGKPAGTLTLPGGVSDLGAQDGVVWVNDAKGADAKVVDAAGDVTGVTKYTVDSTRHTLADKPKADQPLAPTPPPPTYAGTGSHGSRRGAPGTTSRPGGSTGGSRTTGTAPPATAPPGLPLMVAVQPGDSSATISWSPPASGGTPATYTVQDSLGGSQDVPASGTTVTETSLSNDQQICFTVSATNSAGTGPGTAPTCTTPSADVPGPVATVTVSSTGDATATIDWSAATDGRSPLTGYTITVDPAVAGSPFSVPPAPLTKQVTGLTNGTDYTFTVAGVNAAGAAGTPGTSDPAHASTTPGAPVNIAVTAGDGTIDASWDPPTDDGGDPVTGYTATINGGSPMTGDGSASWSGLANGTAYTVSVVATNVRGNGPAATGAGTPGRAPEAPTGLAVSGTNATAHLTWSASADNGYAVSNYVVTWGAQDGSPGNQTMNVGTATSVDLPVDVADHVYDFSVNATNAKGDSGEGTTSGATTSSWTVTINLAGMATNDGECTQDAAAVCHLKMHSKADPSTAKVAQTLDNGAQASVLYGCADTRTVHGNGYWLYVNLLGGHHAWAAAYWAGNLQGKDAPAGFRNLTNCNDFTAN